jgi:hypothetical protein
MNIPTKEMTFQILFAHFLEKDTTYYTVNTNKTMKICKK